MNRTEYETVWEFRTAHLSIALEVAPETDSPAGHFQFPEDVKFARRGGAHWFQARVAVYDEHGSELGADYLGACSYRSFKEFYTSHRDPDPANRNCFETNKRHRIAHYFPDMVREAATAARRRLIEMHDIPVRRV